MSHTNSVNDSISFFIKIAGSKSIKLILVDLVSGDSPPLVKSTTIRNG